MTNFKYMDIENVEVKKDFKIHSFDKSEEMIIKTGTKGIIDSVACCRENNFSINYEVIFTQNNENILVEIPESKMGELLIFL